jgi:hypothetical protein
MIKLIVTVLYHLCPILAVAASVAVYIYNWNRSLVGCVLIDCAHNRLRFSISNPRGSSNSFASLCAFPAPGFGGAFGPAGAEESLVL